MSNIETKPTKENEMRLCSICTTVWKTEYDLKYCPDCGNELTIMKVRNISAQLVDGHEDCGDLSTLFG